jgi:hypothetical protein
VNFCRSSLYTACMNIMCCCCYHYMSPYWQSLISNHVAEHCKGNDYNIRNQCNVMVYNLFLSLFLHLLTNKFHSYEFECGIEKKFGLHQHTMLFDNAIGTFEWYFLLFVLHVASQTWFLGMEVSDIFLPLFKTWWNVFKWNDIILLMFLTSADDTVWNTNVQQMTEMS